MKAMYYNRNSEPITQDEWMRSFNANRGVVSDVIGGAYVSTVWLGLDHSYSNGPPLIFETMVFGGKHDGHTRRYVMEAEALDGHKAIVAAIRDGKPLT